MIPIQNLLNRIRWDKKFAASDFSVGYFDRVANEIIRVPFTTLRMNPENHNQLQLTDEEGVVHSIPLHRIREVLRNGKLIWRRDASTPTSHEAS